MSERKIDGGTPVRTRKVKAKKTEFSPRTEIDQEKRIIRTVYDSTSQLRSHFEASEVLKGWLDHYVSPAMGWMEPGTTPLNAIERATLGESASVPLILSERERAERLDVQVSFPSWQADVVGAFPDVPSFLAGAHDCMRRMVNQVNDTRPVRIFVGMASSCSFNCEQLAKRGALIAALALQLSKTRSVEVWAINSGVKNVPAHGSFDWSGMVKLPATLSAADLSYWLCSQASVRGLLYSIERAMSGPLDWPDRLMGYPNYSSPAAIAAHAELWNATESDIVVPFPKANNPAEAEMLANPETWLRNALERVNAIAA